MTVASAATSAALLAVPVLSGAAVGAWSAGRMRGRSPRWAPPAWVFGVAWTALYALMGAASALVWRQSGLGAAMLLYGVQLAINLAWTPVFLSSARAGLWLLAALLAVVLATAAAFARASWVAGALMLPYVAWLGFALALNTAAAKVEADSLNSKPRLG